MCDQNRTIHLIDCKAGWLGTSGQRGRRGLCEEARPKETKWMPTFEVEGLLAKAPPISVSFGARQASSSAMAYHSICDLAFNTASTRLRTWSFSIMTVM